jgi:methionyl-tRNA synthetase
MSDASRTTIVICPFATPNGPLHIGHLAGPYLAGDVYARYLRANGHKVIFPTGTDENQTYVTTTALRRGVSEAQLVADSAAGVWESQQAAGISTDVFVPSGESYNRAILDFLMPLYEAGKLRVRETPLPYSVRDGRFLLDGMVVGDCPMCLVATCGGICETCGHPVDYAKMRGLRSTLDDDRVELRSIPLLVLPMEEYREQLRTFHANRPYRWRPHVEQIIAEMLDRPLLDLPITYPIKRGIPAPFPETPGQVINPWAEAIPQCIHGTWYAATHPGLADLAADEHWRYEHNAELVYFLGFDNAPNWAMTYMALLLAHGDRYIRPASIVCNEFYELDHQKFSTSRNHVIWTQDLAAEVPRDLIRFYAALTAPENQRTNFSRAAMRAVVTQRLIEPWNLLSEGLAKLAAGLPPNVELAAGTAGRQRAEALKARFRLCYELPSFSLTRAAEAIGDHVDRLQAVARAQGDVEGIADFIAEVHTLLACAAPILIDATAGYSGPLSPGASLPVAGVPELPRLSLSLSQ